MIIDSFIHQHPTPPTGDQHDGERLSFSPQGAYGRREHTAQEWGPRVQRPQPGES
jgi:hypothetical protein